MAETTDTVTIQTDEGPVRINASDYDAKKHKLAKEDKEELPVTTPTTFVAPEKVETPASAPVMREEGVTRHEGAHAENPTPNNGNRPVALEAPQAPASGEAGSVDRRVMKIGRKFFVVNAEGAKVEAEGIDADGYSSEQDAWTAAVPNLAG